MKPVQFLERDLVALMCVFFIFYSVPRRWDCYFHHRKPFRPLSGHCYSRYVDVIVQRSLALYPHMPDESRRWSRE